MARYGVWAPIPQWAGSTQKWATGRNGRRLTAVVIHRMEGSLVGSDGYLRREFADYYPYPRLRASTHFGIGNWPIGGTPQIRQWVDTANSAWGWYGRPESGKPSAVARNVLANWASAYEDLNWQVISIEIEGFAAQVWNQRWTPKLKELLSWIYRTHGDLVVLVHNDNSYKACPGLSQFKAGLPGWYGNRLSNIVGSTVTPTPTPVPTPTVKAGGLPVTFTSRYGWRATIKPYKPRRSGATIAQSNWGNTDSNGEAFAIWGEVVGEDLGKYGVSGGKRWFFGPQWISGKGWKVVYIPLVDLTNRNF